MSSQRVLVEGRALLGPCSRNGRVYSQQVMQDAGIVFQPYVVGLFDQVWSPEESAQTWKERHINEIKEAGKDYDC